MRKAAFIFLAALFIFGCAGKKKAPVVTATEPTTGSSAVPLPAEAPEESPAIATSPEPVATEEEAAELPPETPAPEVETPQPAPEVQPIETIPELEFSSPTLETPTPPDSALAKFREFWLGMSIENFSRVALGPPKVREAAQATPEAEAPTPTEPEKKIESKPIYRLLPLVIAEPEVRRFIYTDPADVSVDHATFRFFKERLGEIEVYYRTSYFHNVGLDDFISRIKEVYGEPTSEKWKTPRVTGRLTWENETFSVQLVIYNGRPFLLKLSHLEMGKEELAYIEELKKTESSNKLEKLRF